MGLIKPDVKELAERRDVEGLIEALHDENDADVRKAAAKALGQTGDVRAVEPLIVALGDMYEDVCKAAVEALGQIGDARAVKSLIAALEDGWTIRYNAAKQRDKTDDTYVDESTAQRQKSLEVALQYS
ncbi:MAG: HEAT repeat domain-containing protein, partial [Eubacteriales bacterium]|nr:HEAT repeat domain-containing protein [Eubacteriales bacterium]